VKEKCRRKETPHEIEEGDRNQISVRERTMDDKCLFYFLFFKNWNCLFGYYLFDFFFFKESSTRYGLVCVCVCACVYIYTYSTYISDKRARICNMNASHPTPFFHHCCCGGRVVVMEGIVEGESPSSSLSVSEISLEVMVLFPKLKESARRRWAVLSSSAMG